MPFVSVSAVNSCNSVSLGSGVAISSPVGSSSMNQLSINSLAVFIDVTMLASTQNVPSSVSAYYSLIRTGLHTVPALVATEAVQNTCQNATVLLELPPAPDVSQAYAMRRQKSDDVCLHAVDGEVFRMAEHPATHVAYCVTPKVRTCCLLVALRPSNMRVYLRDGSAQTILRAATLREKLQTKLSI